MIVQIYEIQQIEEAKQLVTLGVDHLGTMLTEAEQWKDPKLKNPADCVQNLGAKSSLIPLFSSLDLICETLAYYRPNIVHFCEAIVNGDGSNKKHRDLVSLQREIKKQFPSIQIMRSIPIGEPGCSHSVSSLVLAKQFEPVSDYFLTDTYLKADSKEQPVSGFVGITGRIYDWSVAAELVRQSNIPVILGGGISNWDCRDS